MIVLDGVRSLLQTRPQVICVARNYVDHCHELNNQIPTRPNFFYKSTSSLICPPAPVLIPTNIGGVHYEAEVAVIIGKKAENICAQNVFEYIAGVTGAIDITAREVQEFEKKEQLPWTLSKSLRTFCPICSDWIQVENENDLKNLEIKLTQDGITKQSGSSENMIFKIPQLLSYLSTLITLNPGDIILTGTPAGVGPATIGSILTISIASKKGFTVSGSFEVIGAAEVESGVVTFPFK